MTDYRGFKFITKPDIEEAWKNVKDLPMDETSKMIILDDYRMLMPSKKILKKSKKLLSQLNKYNEGIEIRFGKFKLK